jgi:oligopeptidase A
MTLEREIDEAQKRIIDNAILSAQLSGVALKGEQKAKFNTISEELATLMRQFANNLLDSSKEYQLKLTNSSDIDGLPSRVLEEAAQRARSKGDTKATAETGPWVFTLDAPSYLPFMQHARNRDLRQQLWHAYNHR